MENLHNINIERSLLSSIFFNPELYEETASKIKPSDFYLPAHKNIFEAIDFCSKNEKPIDEQFVKERLLSLKKFDEEAMLYIISTNPLPSVGAYAEEIKQKSLKRDLVSLSSSIHEATIEMELSATQIMDTIEQKLYQISQSSDTREFRDSQSIVVGTLEHIKEMKLRGNNGVVGLDTGFSKLNELTTGFGNGDLIIVAARPAMGKTAFCLNLAQKTLDMGKGVAFFSLEMPAEQLMLRMLSAKTSLPLQKIKIGDLNDEEWGHMNTACDVMAKSQLFVDDGQNVDIHKVRAKLRKLKQKNPEVALCIIDYMQLMIGDSKKDRHLEVSEISRGLKLLARELEMPIIALSQLNRGLEGRDDKRPMLSDLRESGAIEQDADLILFVYRDDVYKQQEERSREKKMKNEGKEYKSEYVPKAQEDTELIIGKNRNGPTGTAHLTFIKSCTRFVDKAATPYKVVTEEKSAVMDVGEPIISVPRI